MTSKNAIETLTRRSISCRLANYGNDPTKGLSVETSEIVRMFVNGQAMSGGTLNHALAGAELLGPARTAAAYRFYAVRDEFPGLHPVDDATGASIAGELYAVDYRTLRTELLPNEPEELELGMIELDDGRGSLAMRMRAAWLEADGVTDITAHGGWRTHLRSIEKEADGSAPR